MHTATPSAAHTPHCHVHTFIRALIMCMFYRRQSSAVPLCECSYSAAVSTTNYRIYTHRSPPQYMLLPSSNSVFVLVSTASEVSGNHSFHLSSVVSSFEHCFRRCVCVNAYECADAFESLHQYVNTCERTHS